MKQIRLVAEDFNSLNRLTKEEHEDIYDCPIARALRSKFKKKICVGSTIVFIGWVQYRIDGYYDSVDKAREKLKKGAKYAIIKVYS